MAVGASSLLEGLSYLGIGRETTYGDFNTTLAGLDFISSSLKMQKDSRILDQVERSRTMGKRIQLSRSLTGDTEWYFRPLETADSYLLQNAFGGAVVTSATATGETVGGAAFSHIFTVGNFDLTHSSLCIGTRKGDSTNGRTFEYTGIRVNEFTLNGAVDEPVMCSVSMIGKDSTLTSSDFESQFTATGNPCLSFVDGRISVETTFASLTSSSFWHVQSVDFKITNDLKSGSEARRIGSDTLDVLPPGVQRYELSMNIRFDTSTAYEAMLAATEFGAELEFLGATISTSVIQQGLLLEFQKIYIKDAGDPEITGPDGILQSLVTFDVLRDESASGYACRATVTNNISSV